MSNITLTIPNDDHIALRAFGKALEEMALAHGAPLQLKINEEALSKALGELQQAAPRMMQELRCNGDELQGPEVDTTAQQVESLAAKEWPKEQCPVTGAVHDVDPSEVPHSTLLEHGIDSTGTPWDERIHSTSKALNADGTWRLRRKPKDMDDAEWGAYLRSVADELVSGSHGSDAGGNSSETEENTNEIKDIIPAEIEPPVTPPGDDFHTDAGVVTEQTVAGIPPIPVPPPVVVPPADIGVYQGGAGTVGSGATGVEWDFPKLMKFLTERQGKIDVPTVNMLLALDGITSLPELNAHPDKIGPFVARVKAHLGE